MAVLVVVAGSMGEGRWPAAGHRCTAATGLRVPEGGTLVARTHLSAGASAAPLEASRRHGSALPAALGGRVWARPVGRSPDSPLVQGDTGGPQAGLGKAGHTGVGAGSASVCPAVGPSRQTGGRSCRPAHCALCRAAPWGPQTLPTSCAQATSLGASLSAELTEAVRVQLMPTARPTTSLPLASCVAEPGCSVSCPGVRAVGAGGPGSRVCRPRKPQASPDAAHTAGPQQQLGRPVCRWDLTGAVL